MSMISALGVGSASGCGASGLEVMRSNVSGSAGRAAGGRCCAAAETPQDHAFLAVDDGCRRGTSEAPLTT